MLLERPLARLVVRLALAALAPCTLPAAQTIGSPSPGLTLFAPNTSTTTYLIDLSGTVVHSWPSTLGPGNSVYLDTTGNLFRAVDTGSGFGPDSGGRGGGLQEIAFDGTLLWDYRYDTPTARTHHDYKLLPNGNVLLISWERRSQAEAIAEGRDPAIVQADWFWPDHVIEVSKTGPTTGTVVWQWNVWDHMVQDFDPTKPNFDAVANRPERIDINYPPLDPFNGDWTHLNGIDYHAGFDQIMVSPREFHELWIIDHSTTTAEAAGTTGGQSGKGGDLLYRWGNPQAYGAGTASDQVFFGQHDTVWVEDGYPGAGNITIFNNGIGRPAGPISSVDEITPPVDASGNYALTPGSAHGPSSLAWTYQDPIPTSFYSAFISGSVRLANGNTLICEGLSGRLFEVDPLGNTVWTYFNTLGATTPGVFKVRRYEHHLFPSSETISASAGGTVRYGLVSGSEHAGRLYLLLASFSGTSPGTPLPGGLVTMPLNADALSNLVLANANTPAFQGFFGFLDGTGNASATLNLGPGLDPSLVGLTADFAFLLAPPYDFVSNAMPLTFVP